MAFDIIWPVAASEPASLGEHDIVVAWDDDVGEFEYILEAFQGVGEVSGAFPGSYLEDVLAGECGVACEDDGAGWWREEEACGADGRTMERVEVDLLGEFFWGW